MIPTLRLCGVSLFLLLAWPRDVFANVGLPMLAIAWPSMFIAFVPVVVIESWYLHYRLGLPVGRSIKVTTIANLESTIIGIPLAWLAMLIIGLISGAFLYLIDPHYMLPHSVKNAFQITLGSAWFPPAKNPPQWLISAAFLFLLIPFYFVTWWYEYGSVKRQLKDMDATQIKIATRNMNLISYTGIGVLVVIRLILDLTKSV